jgi:nucleotide-binding universal stress UspA family protein
MTPRIVFPTDFSATADTALDFAAKMIEKAGNGQLIFFHAYHLPTLDTGMESSMLERMEEEAREEAYRRLRESAQQKAERYRQATGWELNYAIEALPGFAIESMPDAVDKHSANFVVMGTRGAGGGLTQHLLGSNAADAIEKLHVPVLTVPELGRYHGIKRVVYATDCTAADRERLPQLVAFTNLFQAHLEVLYIGGDEAERRLAQYRDAVYDLLPSQGVEFLHRPADSSTEDALLKFLEEVQADVVALYHRDRNFLQGLFHKSLTKRLAFHSHIPVLSIPERG